MTEHGERPVRDGDTEAVVDGVDDVEHPGVGTDGSLHNTPHHHGHPGVGTDGSLHSEHPNAEDEQPDA